MFMSHVCFFFEISDEHGIRKNIKIINNNDFLLTQ